MLAKWFVLMVLIYFPCQTVPVIFTLIPVILYFSLESIRGTGDSVFVGCVVGKRGLLMDVNLPHHHTIDKINDDECPQPR